MNNKLLLSRSVAKIAIVLVAVVAILVTLTFTAPYRAFADDNYQPNVDPTENAEVPGSDDSTSETSSNVSDGDSEDPAPVDGVVVPGNDDADSASNDSGAETVEIPLGEDRAPSPQQRGESRQARQRGFETWQTNLENGPLVTRIRQQKPQRQDPKEESQVFMRHTITKDTVVSGPLEAKVQFQNGFDVTGLHGAAELRIYDPNGREIRTVQGNPNSDRIPAVDNTGGNGWGGLLFRFDGEIAVSAGSTFEVDMVFHGRGKNNVRRQNPNFQGPLGPGVLNYKSTSTYKHRDQSVIVCGQVLDRNSVTGFKIYPSKDFTGEIREIKAVGVLVSGSLQKVNNEIESEFNGLNSNSLFLKPVDRKGTHMCIQVRLDADEQINTARVNEYLQVSFQHEFFPNAPNSAFEDIVKDPKHDWDKPKQKNPLHSQQRCGLNIAIVLDASNSMMIDGGELVRKVNRLKGVINMKDAADRVIDNLSGTGSSVGIYNFASQAPRKAPGFMEAQVSSHRLATEADVKFLKAKTQEYVNAMNHEILLGSREHSGTGSTNWEAALKQIRDYNAENPTNIYDAVYFVTDGLPTVSDSPKPGGGEVGAGGVVHVTDVSRARDVADELKSQGTLVQPILVNLPRSTKRVVAKDSSVAYDRVETYYELHRKVPGHVYYTYFREGGEKENLTETQLESEIEKQYVDIYQGGRKIWRGYGMGDVLAAKRIPQPIPDRSRGTLAQEDLVSWAAGLRSPMEIGNSIGDNNAVVLEDLAELEITLSKLALASCGGSVTLTKELIDANGQPIQDASVAGWEFKAHTPEGSFLLVDERRVPTTTASTGDDGHVRFQLETDTPDQHVAVDLTETQRPGFELAKLGDAEDSPHAQCSVQHLDSGTTELLPVQNLVSGFNVQASAGQVITCRVVNRKLPDEMRFKISKLDFETQQPIDGAKFQVFAANDQGQPNWERGPIWDTDNQSTQTMNPGEYYLVETQAPQGYSLLPQPVYFELAQNERGTYLSAAAPFIVNTRIDQEQDAQGRPVYVAVMELANVLKGDLPLTGGRGIWGFALAGFIILAMGAYFVQRQRVDG